MFHLVSTRFTNDTWLENRDYRNKSNHDGCIYGSSQELSNVHYDSLTFVIEMNNSKNEIEGIGLIINRPLFDKSYFIYSDRNYNRFIYKGNYRLNRDKLLQYSKRLVLSLEYILFREKNHVKRSMGFTRLTQTYIKNKKNDQVNNLKINIIIKTIQLCFNDYFKSKI